MNKINFQIRIDSVIDVITNSSSELFVRKSDVAKEMLVEMINELSCMNAHITDFEERYIQDERPSDTEYTIDKLVQSGAINRIDLKVQWYGISFDRDWIYQMDQQGMDVRQHMHNCGFELIDTDY